MHECPLFVQVALLNNTNTPEDSNDVMYDNTEILSVIIIKFYGRIYASRLMTAAKLKEALGSWPVPFVQLNTSKRPSDIATLSVGWTHEFLGLSAESIISSTGCDSPGGSVRDTLPRPTWR